MELNLNQALLAKNEMVQKGQIVEATEQFFASEATTKDFDGTVTKSKEEMIAKMKGFAGAIKAVNGITLHFTALQGNVSFSEFTFDFDMQDGSKILWHEIIRSVWEHGKIVEEQYFKNLGNETSIHHSNHTWCCRLFSRFRSDCISNGVRSGFLNGSSILGLSHNRFCSCRCQFDDQLQIRII